MDSRAAKLKELGLPNLPPTELNEWFDRQAAKNAKPAEIPITRQTKRQKQIATLENQVKELTYLLGVTTNALGKASSLMGVLSPDTARRFNDVLQLVNEKKLSILGKLD